jgi:hypothetical protein
MRERHLLVLEQAGDEPRTLIHDVTLLPRHAPSSWGQSVTHPLGIRRYLSLRKDIGNSAILSPACETRRPERVSVGLRRWPNDNLFDLQRRFPGGRRRHKCRLLSSRVG